MIGASVRFRFLLIAVAVGFIVLAVTWLPGMHSEAESLVTVPLEKNLFALPVLYLRMGRGRRGRGQNAQPLSGGTWSGGTLRA